MFSIRTEQIEALRSAARESFETRAVKYLQEHYPKQASELGSTGVHNLLIQSELEATTHQLGTEFGVLTWAELKIRYGPSFHFRESWAAYLTKAIEVDLVKRVNRLREYI